MPIRPCSEPGCATPASARGRCDKHRRQLERVRSAMRRGGYKRGPYKYVTEARDENPDYTPTKHRKGSDRDEDVPGAGGLAGWDTEPQGDGTEAGS